jgi:hypothetical protein
VNVMLSEKGFLDIPGSTGISKYRACGEVFRSVKDIGAFGLHLTL